MLRFFAGVGSALLLVSAGFFIWTGMAQDEEDPVPDAPTQAAGPIVAGAPTRPPSADERTKEQRRFDRADRDNDGKITLEELFYPRRRAFQRLDTNGDGRLAFEEWAVRTSTKFGEADANRDRALSRPEFAATAPRRRTPARPANCRC
ncbi:MAG TPA: histidine kinase [Allosphingosinicella sp.]|nr:histidine kinase [Allosphingosinicella sp.]